MTDSVIICIKLFIRSRFYLELYLIQVLLSRSDRPSVFARKWVHAGQISLVVSGVRAGHVQDIYSDFVLRRYNIQMKVLEGCLGLLRGLISAKYLIQGRRFERNTNVKGLKPPVIITTWKWLITCPLIDLI